MFWYSHNPAGGAGLPITPGVVDGRQFAVVVRAKDIGPKHQDSKDYQNHDKCEQQQRAFVGVFHGDKVREANAWWPMLKI
jgi:hypothetical protein